MTFFSFIQLFGVVIYWLSVNGGFGGSGYKDKELYEAVIGIGLSLLSFLLCYSGWRTLT